MLTPDKVINKYGLTINQKIIPMKTKWTKNYGEFKIGDLYKADKIMESCIGVTIHNTNDLENVHDDAEQYTRATFNQNMGSARVHFYVDDVSAWQNLELNEIGWHSATGGNGQGNINTIAIEIIMDSSGNKEDLGAYENGAKLTAILLYENNWNLNNIYTHNHWYSKKYCPLYILPKWQEFLNKVQYYLDEIIKLNSPTPLYRVQVGAFSKLENANKLVIDLMNKGYKDAFVAKIEKQDVIDMELITEQVTEQVKNEYEQKFKDYKESLVKYIDESEW